MTWRLKVAAWTHDPAEKAMVLLRDPSGHEGGTVRALFTELFGTPTIPSDLVPIVKRADHWASAADRPQFPRDPDNRFASWTRVNFAHWPVLVHPLSGVHYDLKNLREVSFEAIKAVSIDHLSSLIARDAGEVDWKKTFLRLWRLGPELGAPGLGALWQALPADTRVPDHSIWEHLRLVSAFAAAMEGGESPALLSVSFGPVQSFIAQARSTSDLWAGSHILSRIAWEGMRVIAERLGPDAILFPNLHGVPIVDLWLVQSGAMTLDEGDGKLGSPSDSNPLFSAALPNRFLALVPERLARTLAEDITREVRGWVLDRAEHAWREVLGDEVDATGIAGEQMRRQLAEFPEVHWSAVPWSLVGMDANGKVSTDERLRLALSTFHPEGSSGGPGFLGSPAWLVLKGDVNVAGAKFYEANPGAAYPAVYELADRLLAASKMTREFQQSAEEGYRCTLCGEREWLTVDRNLLDHARGSTGKNDPWRRLADRRPGWVRSGDHLCALCALKRVWPRLFQQELQDQLGGDRVHRRYVVSTHTMALAASLEKLVALDLAGEHPQVPNLGNEASGAWTALPRRLADKLRQASEPVAEFVRSLPARLDDLRDQAREGGHDGVAAARELEGLKSAVKKALGADPDTYYALVLMDGDRMGAWLTAAEGCERPAYRKIWHPSVSEGAKGLAAAGGEIQGYLNVSAPSPAYHAAISSALNAFSTTIARVVVEDLNLGKLIYSGGDDVLAMVSVDDLPRVMLLLRLAYSGISPGDLKDALELDGKLQLGGGYVRTQRGALLRTMGKSATASIGAVIAHHMAPLGGVLRELRAAEQRAKRAGPDAFSFTLLKRSGGASTFTAQFGLKGVDDTKAPVADGALWLVERLRRALVTDLSRRAAYHMISWLPDLPARPESPGLSEEEYRKLLSATLAHQMWRQRRSEKMDRGEIDRLAESLAQFAVREVSKIKKGSGEDYKRGAPGILTDLITLAEFLHRRDAEPANAESDGGGR